MPSSSESLKRWVALAFGVAIGIALLAYPYLLGGLLARFGVRASCAILLAISLVSIALGARARAAVGARAWPALAIAAALLAGLLSGRPGALLLIPAIVYLGVAEVFARSLAREDSILERGVRFLLPVAPDFIRAYCRGVTWLWTGLLAASGVAIAGLALAGSLAAWQAVTGWGIYALMLVVSAIEFFVRKTWFRYYFHGGPFDRFWSRLFPAENTEQGRRSAEYIRRFREQAAQNARAEG